MDLYSEELPIDVINSDIDGNQVVYEKSDEIISQLEKQSSISNDKVGCNSYLDNEVSAQNRENNTHNLQKEHSYMIIESVEATEINNKTQKSEKVNLEENPESRNDNQLANTTEENNTKQTDDNPESNDRKRRGRRSLKELSDLKPTRESTRKRKRALVFDYHNNASMKKRFVWSSEEKLQLLRGLEEFGVDDVKGVQSYVQSKPESSICNQIRVCRELGRDNFENILQSQERNDKSNARFNCILRLNEWGEYFEELAEKSPQRLFALSNIFSLISEYGRFPEPSECEGIDFRAMYRYLHCMMNGKPYYGVNRTTAGIILQCLTNVIGHLQAQPEQNQLIRHLLQESLKKPMKTYSRAHTKKLPASTLEKPDGFLYLPGMNPLNIPVSSLLLKPEGGQGEGSSAYRDDSDTSDTDNEWMNISLY